jgi:hypothetical protein
MNSLMLRRQGSLLDASQGQTGDAHGKSTSI